MSKEGLYNDNNCYMGFITATYEKEEEFGFVVWA